MMRLEPPKQFSFKAEEWPAWIREYKRFANASKLKNEEGDVQRDTLLYVMGPESDKVHRTLVFEGNESDTNIDLLIAKLDDYFVVKKNVIYERSKFHERKQAVDETVEEYYRALKELARHCEYPDEDNQIRDRLVVGLIDKTLKEKLQLQRKLTLASAVSQARSHEQIKAQSQEQESKIEETRRTTYRGRGRRFQRGNRESHRDSQGKHREKKNSGEKCGRCGYDPPHSFSKCPAKDQQCKACKKYGHFKSVCRNTFKRVQEVESESDEVYFLDAVVKEVQDDNNPWTVNLKIKDTPVKFKIDTGADISIMSDKVFRNLMRKPQLTKCNHKLSSPGGRLPVKGQFYAKTAYKGKEYKFKVVVVNNRVNTLLSRSVAEKMGLVARIEEVNHNIEEVDHELFESKGLLDTEPVEIKLSPDATPYCQTTARRVPFPLQKKVKDEIDRLTEAGIITPVEEATDWCAPMVPVQKPSGAIRICVDYKRLNSAVKRPNCMLPNLEDIAPKMAGATIFSTIDAESGFFQVPLAEKSMKLTTFITPYGRYCFKRVPMGISLGPEVFQTKMKELLRGLEGCEPIMDDTIIYGKTIEEHDQRLEAVLNRIKASGLRLNKKKCHFRQKEVKFFGHVISADGIRPDPEKVLAVKEMPRPTNISELRTVCGMMNYLTKFVPNLATILKPVTDLLKSSKAWFWGPDQDKAFEKAKEKLSEAPALAFYCEKRKTVVSADSSSYGLGATIMQETERGLVPIAYASRTLNEAEKKYAQIEKECLASVWACEKFAKYLIGLDSFELQTDHKPLVPLMRTKDIDSAPLRCQRLLIRLMRFNASVHHVPGKELVIADALSRHPRPDTESELSEEVTAHVDTVMSSQQISTRRMDSLKAATVHDKELQRVADYILNGWPQTVPENMIPYKQVEGDLSLADGLIVYQNRIVVPSSQRKEILDKLHESHQGLWKSRQNAQATVWWPGITRDLKQKIETCRDCCENKPKQRSEPLKPTELPNRPWQKLGADLFQLKGKDFIVVVDYYSRWLEIHQLHTTTASAVVKKLKITFATHGVPELIFSDNGPQFDCGEFKKFAAEYDFSHDTSSPGFPQANGAAESAVKIAKKILSQTDPDLALLNYRATPHTSTGVSPAAALMGRQLRTKLPILPINLSPKQIDDDIIRAADERTKEMSRRNFNKRTGAVSLPALRPGEAVLLRSGEKWGDEGSVVAADVDNRTYLINTPTGVLRRNRRDIQLLPETPAPDISEPVEDRVDTNPVDVDPPRRPTTRSLSGYRARKPVRFSD